MNKKINVNVILIIFIILLICLNIVLVSIYLNNRNSNIVEQDVSKKQLTTTTASNAYLNKSAHLSELNEEYQKGYEAGSANAYVDAFNYHFKVTIPCYFQFGLDDWTKSNTVSYYIEYDGGTIKRSTLNSLTKATYGSTYTGLQLTGAKVVISEKDVFTATFNLKQTLEASKTATATVKYNKGKTTTSFATTSWSSGDFDMIMKKNPNANATVKIY